MTSSEQPDLSPLASPSSSRRYRRLRKQETLFDLRPHVAMGTRCPRLIALDRPFIIAALRDIYRLSSEEHIRRIVDDVFFAHHIPLEETPSANDPHDASPEG